MEDPGTLRAEMTLAYAYQQAGILETAIPLLDRTLADFERLLGADARETLNARHNLAAAYDEAGAWMRPSRCMYERALADCERVLGADAPETLTVRANLGTAYEKSGRAVDAISRLERTLAERMQVLGERHPDTQDEIEIAPTPRRLRVIACKHELCAGLNSGLWLVARH